MKNILYTKYSNERAFQFAIKTTILQEGERKWVEKVPLNDAAKKHIENLETAYHKLTEIYADTPLSPCPVTVQNAVASFEFIEGESFQSELSRLIEADDSEGVIKLCQQFVTLVKSGSGIKKFQKTPEFVRLFGDVMLPEGLTARDYNNMDMIFENLIKTCEGKVILLDYEWCFPFPIPQEYILYRAIRVSLERLSWSEFVNRTLCSILGIDHELIPLFLEMDRHFSQVVGTEKTLAILDAVGQFRNQKIDFSHALFFLQQVQCHSQLFFDMGMGFQESQTQNFSHYYGKDLELRIPVEKNTYAFRLDPADEPVLVLVKKCCFSSENGLRDIPLESNGLSVGNTFVFNTNDPQFYILKLEPGVLEIQMTLNIIRLTREIAEEYVRQQCRQEEARRQLIHQQEEATRQLIHQQEEATQQLMCQHEETKQQLLHQQDELKQQLLQAQSAYNAISNAFFWKITKPLRLIAESGKRYCYHVRKIPHLAKRSIYVLGTEGIRGFVKKYGEYKARAHSISINTNVNYTALNSFFRNNLLEPDIPKGWLDLQQYAPLISIILAVKNIQNRKDCLCRALMSLCAQKYKKFEVLMVCPTEEIREVESTIYPYLDTITIHLIPAEDKLNRYDFWDLAIGCASGEFIGIMEQEDVLTENALAYVLEGCNESPDIQLFVIPDDRFFEDNSYFSPDYKVGLEYGIGGWQTLLRFGVFRNYKYKFAEGQMEHWLRELTKEEITVIPWVGCHGQALPSVWEEENIRCVAFYLPQFHEIPENNLWWGKGFTEWVNVKKAKPLYQGHQQPRVPEELGYYDLAGETGRNIQKRQIELAKEYGLNGFCYYYYWFDEGKRLLEMPLDRHLQDQTMDFPFCICWANENWTRQWDGQASEVIMPQTYKDGWAEQFIIDLIPYLKDSRYICVNGAPYILIYNIGDIVNAQEAINTWRKIAAENGIGRLHISAVRRTPGAEELELSGHTLDSLTDFPPHLLSQIGVDHDHAERFGLLPGQVKDYRKACTYHVGMGKERYTYFRTAMLAWDNTARRKDKAYIFEEFSLADYKKWLYAAKRYVLRQNREGEDLVFINAWNEWAEGTYLEPSEPMKNAALIATKEALEMR